MFSDPEGRVLYTVNDRDKDSGQASGGKRGLSLAESQNENRARKEHNCESSWSPFVMQIIKRHHNSFGTNASTLEHLKCPTRLAGRDWTTHTQYIAKRRHTYGF